jgi:hypothetical protein
LVVFLKNGKSFAFGQSGTLVHGGAAETFPSGSSLFALGSKPPHESIQTKLHAAFYPPSVTLYPYSQIGYKFINLYVPGNSGGLRTRRTPSVENSLLKLPRLGVKTCYPDPRCRIEPCRGSRTHSTALKNRTYRSKSPLLTSYSQGFSEGFSE